MEPKINKYAVNIMWNDNDDGYIATCPEFPGLSAFGETPEAALHEARIAVGLFIKTYEEDGIPIPEPQSVQEYSGQFRLRIPRSLHARIARMAETEDVSINQFVLDALAEYLGGKEAHNRAMKELKRAINDLVLQRNLMAQSANWPETRPYRFEFERETTKLRLVEGTAETKGTTGRGN